MIIKCKMCGGDLHPAENATTCTCEFCGSVQTIPKLDNERRMNLYDRGNHFRRQNEYDKAMGIFEQILQDDRTDAEAYWSLVLCRWGIEYVEDPATKKRLPTVNRVQLTSVLADEDYLSALQYADGFQKSIYEQEARAIDEIQKGILAISRNEQPFDVFICYKETDESGRRTPDSVLANELYHQLTNEGFKVFFSRITLEDKIGTAYEPYIFAALQSARVMVVLGTKPEYFKAVWVRNEWSRFLAMIRAGAKKTLVPAYRDMDPYDLPDEFSHLQAQDMGRLGFMQDLIRGIRKILGEEKPAAPVQQTIVQQAPAESTGNISALLDRAFMALEDGEFDQADEFCEQVLNQDARNARAYLGKLMAALEVQFPEQLGQQTDPFDQDGNYQKIMRFGDNALKNQLKSWHQAVEDRLEKQRRTAIAKDALQLLNKAYHIKDYPEIKAQVGRIITAIAGTEEEKQVMAACEEKEKNLQETQYQHALKYLNNRNWITAESAFAALGNYRDSREKVAECREARQNEAYLQAQSLLDKKEYQQAEKAFAALDNYRDSREKATQCWELQQKLQKEAAEAERKRQAAAEAAAARKKLISLISAAIAVIAIVAILVVTQVIIPMNHYNKASQLLEEEKYEMAVAEFTLAGNYSDAKERMISYAYSVAEELLAKGDEMGALAFYQKAGNYQDSTAKQLSILSSLSVKLDAGGSHTVSLKKDGTVLAVGSNSGGQCNVSGWRDIVAVSAGNSHTVGLKKDGTVLAVGSNYYGQCDVSSWTDIVAVSAGSFYTVGLKKDGTVVAVGYNSDGQCSVSGWTDIVAVSAGGYHTVGLKKDGTVVAVGSNSGRQCDVSSWRDMVSVSAGNSHTVGLKKNGTVVAVGYYSEGQCNVGSWRDIVAISTGSFHTVGLKKDGTVLAVGYHYDGKCDVDGWRDIVVVSAGNNHTVGLKKDGTVVTAGDNSYSQCNVSSWNLQK